MDALTHAREAGAVVLVLDRIIVIDKPSGLTSEDAAAAHGKKLVHRIDRATSGLLVLADDARTVQRLQRALREGRVTRTYQLVVHGVAHAGRMETTLVRDRGDGLRGTGEGGKPAALELRVVRVASDGRASLCEATLVTGRTHQIRIQLAEAGHPIVGEPVYVRDYRAAGRALMPCARLLLHAYRLVLPDPKSKRDVVVEAPLPASFLEAADAVLPLPRGR
jgi:23S rRNA pseudouridine1911/1915/1917 synthase